MSPSNSDSPTELRFPSRKSYEVYCARGNVQPLDWDDMKPRTFDLPWVVAKPLFARFIERLSQGLTFAAMKGADPERLVIFYFDNSDTPTDSRNSPIHLLESDTTCTWGYLRLGKESKSEHELLSYAPTKGYSCSSYRVIIKVMDEKLLGLIAKIVLEEQQAKNRNWESAVLEYLEKAGLVDEGEAELVKED